MQEPETEFARCGELQIAYQVYGSGPAELVLCGGPAGHVEVYWEEPAVHRWLERLGTFARVAIFDRRGTGASDSGHASPTETEYMEDLSVVIAACGFRRPALLGAVEGAWLCAAFAAAQPEMASALVLLDAAPAGRDVLREDRIQQLTELIASRWGKGDTGALYAPSVAADESFRRWLARLERLAVSPSKAQQLLEVGVRSDVTNALPQIECPTLVIHHQDNAFVPIRLGRAVADAIPNARFVIVPGQDSMPWFHDTGAVIGEVEEFLTGCRTPQRTGHLRALLFTDVVGSTELAAKVDRNGWQRLLGEHDRVVRREIELVGGTVIKTIGDGFLAIFESPYEAVRAAEESMRAITTLGLTLRAGIHLGMVEELAGDVRGLAVNIASRICELATGGEILMSQTAKDVLIDSGLPIEPCSEEQLRGVRGTWPLYALRRPEEVLPAKA